MSISVVLKPLKPGGTVGTLSFCICFLLHIELHREERSSAAHVGYGLLRVGGLSIHSTKTLVPIGETAPAM